ncbi:NADP-dependent oxidoreductase [Streptomyces hoynatensis]|uniref:NADP-dependent oxidoreductase n=1 Tax=Streptomyces hoynatensis TaxID=1141874 RepID=A0A3A9ZA71_9ACTN|nr:NADP-dependent oxidoreductase [Streptomyces hoynatensis]RKN44989.1 NADP-dependent oxidoreductase [Streptomyces hoynatensis]
MRGIGIERFGQTPELRNLPVPEPGPGQVQVAIEAAAVNPLDTAIASGALAAFGEYRFPLTLGMDGAGTVTALGEGVTRFRVGERVFGQFWGVPLQFGTFAEVCVVQAAPALGALAAVPDEMPSHVAAALPTSGMTALGALDRMQVAEGGTLLVIGATGGVGTFAVQAAAARGLRVVATAPAELAGQMRGLGAGEIVTRGAEPLERALRRIVPRGVDAILDVVGDPSLTSRVAGAVRDGGALFSTAFGLDGRLLADERIRTANYRLDRKPERLAELTELVRAGALRPVIGAEVSLAQTPRALAGGVGSTGLRGKTVLRTS